MGGNSASFRRARAVPGRLAATRAARALGTALDRQSLGLREIAAVSALLGVLGLAVLGSYISRGGFYSDDWVHAAWTQYPRHGGVLGTLHAFDSTRYRPGQYIYYPLVQSVLGLHMRAFLLWATLCAVGASVAFYAFLRFHDMGRLEAVAAAALALVFPYSSSTRLWSTATVVSVTLILYLVGTLLVLRALSGRSRRQLPVHIAGSALVLASVMTYEVVAPAVLLSILFYVRVAPWRRAVRAWIVDVVMVVLTLTFVTSGRNQPIGSFGDQLHHVRVIAQQGADLWSRVLVPYGAVPTRLALGALICVAAVAGFVAFTLPPTNPTRRDLVRWLEFLAAGVVATAIGYAMFVPADLYYSPGTLGIGDRTNGFAALGWALTLVAFVRLVATVAFRDLPRTRVAVEVGVVLGVALVGLGYADRLRTESDAYAASFRNQTAILGTMRQTLPHPPHNSTIYLVRSVPWTAPGVPVFVQPWELFGAVQLIYRDASLSGYPLVSPGVLMHCGTNAVQVTPGAFGGPTRYGLAFVLDMATGTTTALRDRATCERVTEATGVAPASTA